MAFEDYLLWRNVGLRGELPDGTPDPTWRGRHGERNSLFADLLVYTGMRLGEAASLLVPEVPVLLGERTLGDLLISAAVAKRHRARTVYLNRRTLQNMHHYLGIERDELVQRARAGGLYPDQPDSLPARRVGRRGLAFDGTAGSASYAKIGVADRRRLLRVGSDGETIEPLWVWLSAQGRPMANSAWQAVFRRANQRCAQFGIPVEVHPHALRHTFAVQMLGLLLRQTVRALGMREDRHLSHGQIKRLLIGNPMRKLQLLLGHAQEATVYTYLDVLDEAQEIVLSALAEWDDQAAAFDRAGLGARVDQ